MKNITTPLLSSAALCGKGETILVIEDEADVRDVIRRLLQFRDYHALTAENGSEGLKIYRQHLDEISLILTDLRMPGVQGKELIQELRAINPDARIVAMSGVLGENDQIEEEPGRLTFLPKPMTLDELLRAVQRVMVGNGSDGLYAGISSRSLRSG